MTTTIVNLKYLLLTWTHGPRPDKRHFKTRHNKRVSSIYVQIGRFEVVGWYR